ncbi:hypothetical protein HON36_03860 [Candidatus Parcubacteria bacterium]|jgi:hypothetical protein|nr:hypothetical protein [Candidatus Parcubacteria bacterium]MBT7228990.1 hypothetical protein [Candidatus Parcubacteria bacterium]
MTKDKDLICKSLLARVKKNQARMAEFNTDLDIYKSGGARSSSINRLMSTIIFDIKRTEETFEDFIWRDNTGVQVPNPDDSMMRMRIVYIKKLEIGAKVFRVGDEIEYSPSKDRFLLNDEAWIEQGELRIIGFSGSKYEPEIVLVNENEEVGSKKRLRVFVLKDIADLIKSK